MGMKLFVWFDLVGLVDLLAWFRMLIWGKTSNIIPIHGYHAPGPAEPSLRLRESGS